MQHFSNLMFIDDDEVDHMGAQRLLKKSGFGGTASHYNCAIKALKVLHDPALEKVDMVFLDVNLPLMNGFEFLAELEQAGHFCPKSLKVYILSTSKRQTEIDRAQQSPFYRGWIEKPLTKENLLTAIDNQNDFVALGWQNDLQSLAS